MSRPNENRLHGQGRQEAPKGATLVGPLEGEDIIALPLPKISPQARRHILSIGVNVKEERAQVRNAGDARRTRKTAGRGMVLKQLRKSRLMQVQPSGPKGSGWRQNRFN